MRKTLSATGLWWLWIALLIIGIDRVLKIWVITHLTYLEPLHLLPFFNFTLAYNTGAAFSFLHSASGWQNILLGTVAGVISIVVFIWLYRLSRSEGLLSASLCLILGGALGNAWDRILYGHVIDFLDFHLGKWHFAIFNIADAAICIGAALMIYHWVVDSKK